MKIFKTITLPFGVMRIKGHLRFNLLGLEFGVMWPAEDWSYGFILAIFGHGICLDKNVGFWIIHETLNDVWGNEVEIEL